MIYKITKKEKEADLEYLKRLYGGQKKIVFLKTLKEKI